MQSNLYPVHPLHTQLSTSRERIEVRDPFPIAETYHTYQKYSDTVKF